MLLKLLRVSVLNKEWIYLFLLKEYVFKSKYCVFLVFELGGIKKKYVFVYI